MKRPNNIRRTHFGHGLFRAMHYRLTLISLAVLVQLITLIVGLWLFGVYYGAVYAAGVVLGILTALYIINGRTNPDMKVAWLVPILLVPYFGGIAYLLFGSSRFTRKSRRALETDEARLRTAFETTPENQTHPAEGESARACAVLRSMSGYPAFRNTDTMYFPDGHTMWQEMLVQLETAEKYIFMEYFIINEGEVWESILEVLCKKAQQGVEVRLIYDDIGCIKTLPVSYPAYLKGFGIKACVFNPFTPVLTSAVNNRDHRKICVIDGHTAFTGGINLSDEYAGLIERFGVWKDTAVMLKGEAVWAFSVMFLDLWDSLHRRQENWNVYRPDPAAAATFSGCGVVQPFCTAPFAEQSAAETLILSMICRAQERLWITTPYLIPSSTLVTALIGAARSGVDVRIVTPHIPDKKSVFVTTRAFYLQLVEVGVKIYEYTPGFIHAKQITMDGSEAMLGSINLDFRSMYLNFECAVYMRDTDCIREIDADLEKVFDVSERMTLEKCRTMERNLIRRIGRSLLRLFAPMM